jgi:DnaJ-class molecular chaperone
MDDIFSQFGFNPFGDPFGRAQPRRNKDLRIKIQIDLKDTLEEQTKTITVKTTNNDDVTVEVKIPRGVTTGTTVKYSGLGDNLFATLPRGDLYIQFEVRSNNNFEVHGIDLLTNISINSIEAIVGCEKIVTGLDNKEFKVSVPSGTQPNSKLRLMGQGLYAMNQNIRGSLIINVSIVTPTLSSHQLEIAKQLLNSFN